MPTLLPPSVPTSQIGRAASEIGMAGLLGGALFGRLALHPSVAEISDHGERGKVLNAAWRRYGMVNSISLAAVIAGWAGARADEAHDRNLSPRERRLARAKDVFVAASTVTGVATAVQGIRFARSAPDGAVPLRDGDHTAPEATEDQARDKRQLNLLGLASLSADLGLVAVHAALAQENFRRPPMRRLRPRLRS
jgi:hypothetical protein